MRDNNHATPAIAPTGTPDGVQSGGLWWQRGGGPAPAEPPDGAVVRIVCGDGTVVLAERDDWSLLGDPADSDNQSTDASQQRWYVHNNEFLCWDKQPRTWGELVDQAQRLIVFVAIPPTSTPIQSASGAGSQAPASEPGPPAPVVEEEPLPTVVQHYLHNVYGPRAASDRAEWAHRTARVLLAGGEPTEPMPRDPYGVTAARVEAIRGIVAAAVRRDGRRA